MAGKMEDILNNCLERIFRGESIEDCLASYPREASELEPLLRTGLSLAQEAAAISPSPELKASVLSRLEARLYATEEKARVKVPFWHMRWVRAVASVAIVFFVGIGTVAASAKALPDGTLYPLKLAVEQARVSLARSNVSRAELHLQFAEERVYEITLMAGEGKEEQIPGLVERFSNHLEEAVGSAQGALRTEGGNWLAGVAPGEGGKSPGVNEDAAAIGNAITESSERSTEMLEAALVETPQASKPALQQAQEDIIGKYQEAIARITGEQ